MRWGMLGLVLVLVGCSSAPPVDSATGTESFTPAPMDTATLSVECSDVDGKGLKSVALRDTGDALEVTWSTTDRDRSAGETSWFVNIQAPDYSSAYQLGVRDMEDSDAQFVFDFIDAQQTNLTVNADLDGDEVVAMFPWDAMPGLGTEVEWSGALTIDGVDAARCPGVGKDSMNPEMLTWSH